MNKVSTTFVPNGTAGGAMTSEMPINNHGSGGAGGTLGYTGVSWPYYSNYPQTQAIPLKLLKKLNNIIKLGLRVGKNGTNNHHKYDYVTEADVVEEMKRVFSEHNLAYIYNELEATQVGDKVTRLKAEIILVDLDSGESYTYTAFGDGHDGTDKGIYKCKTSLQKYFFMKNFLISTGDDVENDSGKPNVATKKTKTVETSNTTNVNTGNTTPTDATTTNISQPNRFVVGSTPTQVAEPKAAAKFKIPKNSNVLKSKATEGDF